MKLKTLFKSEIEDRFAQENFIALEDYVRLDPFRKASFKFMELIVTAFAAPVTFQHSLGFQPKDFILLSVKPDTVAVTAKTDSFTRTTLTVQATAACTIRAFVGRYEET